MKEKHEIVVGFPGQSKKIEVDVPEGDLKPWDLDTKHVHVGTDVTRIDGLAKASGRAKYTYDVNLPGMLYGAILRSPHAKGRLLSLDLGGLKGISGVRAAVPLKQDNQRVRYVGDAVAAVAAETLDAAIDALEKIEARYEEEDHNVDILKAEGAPEMQDAEVQDDWPADADIEEKLGEAALTHTATYRTEVQTHSSLETHGVVARWDGDDLEVWASTQGTFAIRGALPRALDARGIKTGNVLVHSEFVGGGFGSKFSPGDEGLAAALLAKEAGAPVKLMLDRQEEHTCTGNRPSAVMQIRAGLDKDGRITAWDYRSWGGPGYSGSGGRTTFARHYVESATRRGGRPLHIDLKTDSDAARAMRAPGWPQGYFSSEVFLDELAGKAGMDPLDFRMLNDPQVIRAEQWKLGAEKFGWKARRNPEPGKPRAGDDPRFLRGAGLASARWGGMGRTGRPPHGIVCRIHPDGTVESRSGAQDIGTGMKTVMAILTAEELGIAPGQVRVSMGHTDDPSGPASGGSTTTPSLAPAVRHAAGLAKQQLCEAVARHLGVDPSKVVCRNGEVGAPDEAGKPMLKWKEACRLIGPNPIEARGRRFDNYEAFNDGVCGCQFAEVAVDTWTGVVRVTRMLAVQDCGLVIARKLAESQVLGAMIQGISYALHEQRLMDRRSGRMLNADFHNYKITGPEDMPEMEAVMFSVANGATNVGAVGLGEPPMVASPAAIANAVANALGAPVRHLPITPDKVLETLARKEGI